MALALLGAAPVPERDVTITRDDRGIAHVRGKTDADAVFGAIYAQAEDDFPRIERNYLTALGRTAEADGEGAIWGDLRQRLYVDPADLQARFRASPAWLKALMQAWADGLNHYLATHPDVKPQVITRFEPWMALSFTEGSIGGDIERIDLGELAAMYGRPAKGVAANATPFAPSLSKGVFRTRASTGAARTGEKVVEDTKGSNGIAIAPARTANGRALLLINPHTSFYFRAELQMTSEEGLDTYGASTWGQFFIYQGFNRNVGWMHTSSGVDNVDEFAEDVKPCGRALCYRRGKGLKPLAATPVTIAFKGADGRIARRTFTTYRTPHGPIVAKRDGRWIAFAMMWKPVPALEQSWLRTRATDLADYMKIAERRANSSNDTLFADRKGEIAYLHPQFVPVRSTRFDYNRPVDGSDPAADWQRLHTTAELPNAIRPKTGWAMNTNNWPWTAAGPDSPKAADFPRYMDVFGENARGEHALLLLKDRRDWNADALMTAAYDSYLPGFAQLIPQLIDDYERQPRTDLAAPIALLRGWDYRWGLTSTATSLAVFWGDALANEATGLIVDEQLGTSLPAAIARLPAKRRLDALGEAVARLKADFGDWRVPWGRINRFQRLDARIAPHFDDAKPSTAVPFTWAQWGSLASFAAKRWPGTKNWYGTSGNSFVAVVEFGPRVRAWAVTAGGASGDPASPHFRDQIDLYAGGRLRPVYFHPDELEGHVVRTYRPGGSFRPRTE